MIGRNHATVGAVVALGFSPLISDDPVTILLVATTAAGAAVLPDIDHPNASVSKVIPIAGPLLSRFVALVAGGHRNRTHTLEAGTLVTTAALFASQHRLAAACVIATLVCFAAALLGPHLRLVSAASLAEFVIAIIVGLAVFRLNWLPVDWLPAAVAIGYVSHLFTDAITTAGIKPILIAPKFRLRLTRIRTGGFTEGLLGTVAILALIALTYVRIAQPFLG